MNTANKSLLVVAFAAAIGVTCFAADLKSKTAYKSFTERKDYAGGVEAYTLEIARHPKDAELLSGLGKLHYSFAKYSEAKTALERALIIDPKDAEAHNFLGITYSQTGNPAAALKELDLAIACDPALADAHFNRAVVLALHNLPGRATAKASYDRAISLGAEPDAALAQLVK